MKKLLLLLALSACSVKEQSGGGFVDAVSSSSYGTAPALSFRKSSKQVRLNTSRGQRPQSDAITRATYTHATTVANNRAVYKNNEGSFIGFTLAGNTITATALAASEAALDFSAAAQTYTK